jgi:hypothetical protein
MSCATLDCSSFVGPVGPVGPAGPPGSGSSLLSFSSGVYGVGLLTYLLGVLLAQPSGVGLLFMGQDNAFMPSNRAADTLDLARNSFSSVASRAGTLSQLVGRAFISLQGEGVLSDDVKITFTLYTAPATTFASNDFVATPITFSVTVPAGTPGGGSGASVPTFLSGSSSKSVNVVAGQRILLQVAVATNGNGNANQLISTLAFTASTLIA